MVTTLEETIAPLRGDIDERERIEGYLKRPFKTPRMPDGTYESTDFGALVGTYAAFAQAFVEVAYDVLRARYIDYATGRSLDHIGGFALTPRKTGETDEKYRFRLKAHIQRLVSSGTLKEIRVSTTTLLDADLAQVQVTEPFETDPATVELEIDSEVLDTAPVSVEELVSFVDGFRAGGVDVRMTVTGAFMHRSVADLRSGTGYDRGYDEAPYSGRIN